MITLSTNVSVPDSTDPTELSDRDLTRAVAECAQRERVALATLLEHLGEFDARGLHAPAGFDQPYKYLIFTFGWSPSWAWKRLSAARTCRRFPALLDAVRSGDLNLSAVCTLAAVVTEDNLERVLVEATRLTRYELDAWIARLRAESDRTLVVEREQQAPQQYDLGMMASRSHHESREDGEPAPDPLWTPSPPAPFQPTSTVTRLDAKFPRSFHALLRRAQALCAHSPTGRDPVAVLTRSLELLIAVEEKRRFGAKRKVKPARPAPTPLAVEVAPPAPPAVETPTAKAEPEVAPAPTPKKRPTIRTSTRRAVFDRDHGQCTFVGEDGHVCGSDYLLQLHHRVPWARGGEDTVENLTLHCATHNRLEAEREGLGWAGRSPTAADGVDRQRRPT